LFNATHQILTNLNIKTSKYSKKNFFKANRIFLWEQQPVIEDDSVTIHEEEPIDVGSNSQSSQAIKIVDKVWIKPVILEKELCSA